VKPEWGTGGGACSCPVTRRNGLGMAAFGVPPAPAVVIVTVITALSTIEGGARGWEVTDDCELE